MREREREREKLPISSHSFPESIISDYKMRKSAFFVERDRNDALICFFSKNSVKA